LLLSFPSVRFNLRFPFHRRYTLPLGFASRHNAPSFLGSSTFKFVRPVSSNNNPTFANELPLTLVHLFPVFLNPSQFTDGKSIYAKNYQLPPRAMQNHLMCEKILAPPFVSERGAG